MTKNIIIGVLLALLAFAAIMWFRGPIHMRGGHMMSGTGAMQSPLAEVTVPELSKAALAGKAIFDENCAVCHGENASGNDGAGPPLVHIIYEPSHHGDGAFYLAAKQGVRAHHWQFGNMPPIDGVDEDDVTAIIAYVRELQRANGIN